MSGVRRKINTGRRGERTAKKHFAGEGKRAGWGGKKRAKLDSSAQPQGETEHINPAWDRGGSLVRATLKLRTGMSLPGRGVGSVAFPLLNL